MLFDANKTKAKKSATSRKKKEEEEGQKVNSASLSPCALPSKLTRRKEEKEEEEEEPKVKQLFISLSSIHLVQVTHKKSRRRT